MQVLLLTPGADHPDEINLVHQFFDLGLQRLHLRKPAFTCYDYRGYLDRIDARNHHRIVLHDHFDLLEKYDLNGIHFNTAMRGDALLVERFAGYEHKSASFHAWEEIAQNAVSYRYVFISPVFDSISKKGYRAAIDPGGADVLQKEYMAQNRACPALMGLGGVSAENIMTLADHGFDGAVVLGSVWQAQNPLAAFIELMKTANGVYRP